MKTIRHYYVEVSDHSGIIGRRNDFKVEDILILDENDTLMVLKDRYFTVISKESKSYTRECIGKKHVHISASDSVWGNRVTYSLYTFKTVKAATIRKEITAEIYKKFGFFMGQLDLSCITDSPSLQAVK